MAIIPTFLICCITTHIFQALALCQGHGYLITGAHSPQHKDDPAGILHDCKCVSHLHQSENLIKRNLWTPEIKPLLASRLAEATFSSLRKKKKYTQDPSRA